jgi:hypothetical protein
MKYIGKMAETKSLLSTCCTLTPEVQCRLVKSKSRDLADGNNRIDKPASSLNVLERGVISLHG